MVEREAVGGRGEREWERELELENFNTQEQ